MPRAARSPSPFTERGLGGEVQEAQEIAGASPQVEAKPCTLISLAPLSVNGEGGTDALHAPDSPSPFTERGLGGEVKNDSFVIPSEASNLHRSDVVRDNASLSNSFMTDENGKTRLCQMLFTPFFTLLLFFLLSFACAQPRLIAILQSREGGFYADAVNRFHQELEKQGVEAQTLTFALKGDRSDAELPRRILERSPAVILAVGTDAALLLKAHYAKLPREQQVPVVFTMVIDPIGQGLIQGVEQSGSRFAGVALAVRPQRQFRVLLDALPDIKRVGVLYNPNDPVSQRILDQAREDATRLNLSLQEVPLEQPAQIGAALQSLSGKVDALWLIPDPVCAAPEPSQQLIEFAQKNRLPVLAFSDSFVRRGALMGAGVDLAEQGALAAEQTIRILNGEKPEELPLLTPRRALTYYNLKTARALGITIPDMLLNLAEKVYE